MTTSYDNLEQEFARLAQLDHALTILQWDQAVMMPAGGAVARGEAIAELTSMRHQRLTSPRLADWFLEATQTQDQLGPEQCSNLYEMRWQWQNAVVLPSELVRAKSLATSQCEFAWRSQRGANDWRGFLPNFVEVVNISREIACLRQATFDTPTPYDAMLDLYSVGDTSELIDDVFTELKTALPGLLHQVMDKQAGQPVPIFEGHFPHGEQEALGRAVMQVLGFDLQGGRLDVSAHPFSTGVPGDRRITTRYSDNGFLEALYATIHETGHANYEAGLPRAWHYQPVGQSRNMSIHESQSLFYEKQIGGARAFCDFLAPLIQRHLPAVGQLEGHTLWQSRTRVQPGYIRVDADEVTYPLHVILRYEIERDLINGDLECADVPESWNQKMMHFFGLSTRGNDRDGCMQDIHWALGAFGYFPSYTLGAVNAAQLYQAMASDNAELAGELARGDLSFVSDWLSRNIWQKASFSRSQQLVEEATGAGTRAESLLDHLRARYLDEVR